MCAVSSQVSTAGQMKIAALWEAPLAPLAQLERSKRAAGNS